MDAIILFAVVGVLGIIIGGAVIVHERIAGRNH